ncbi:MAG TPA: hypothetical protein VFX02_07145, partial [Gammaproteobacteria bacterium]|nr:hypothetical protein [Gammaproteobacteria bacterium]
VEVQREKRQHVQEFWKKIRGTAAVWSFLAIGAALMIVAQVPAPAGKFILTGGFFLSEPDTHYAKFWISRIRDPKFARNSPVQLVECAGTRTVSWPRLFNIKGA